MGQLLTREARNHYDHRGHVFHVLDGRRPIGQIVRLTGHRAWRMAKNDPRWAVRTCGAGVPFDTDATYATRDQAAAAVKQTRDESYALRPDEHGLTPVDYTVLSIARITDRLERFDAILNGLGVSEETWAQKLANLIDRPEVAATDPDLVAECREKQRARLRTVWGVDTFDDLPRKVGAA